MSTEYTNSNNFSTDLDVVSINGENRIDSRLVAKSLGIEHINFRETLDSYKAELKELGLTRFQTEAVKTTTGRGTKYQKYYLLNEDQSIFAATLSRNTKQVVAFKLKLTKAFSEARARLIQQQEQSKKIRPAINQLWQDRLFLFHEHTKIPIGYFSIFVETANEFHGETYKHIYLSEKSVPDISVGLAWCKYLRSIDFDTDSLPTYPHHYPDQRGTQSANIYPDDLLPTFRRWFYATYKTGQGLKYLQSHQIFVPTAI